MENEKTYKMMDEIVKFIPKIFENEKLLKKHLSCMRYWSDLEWFNILSILYQFPDATNVRTTQAWNKVLNKELYPKRSERGIQIFLPLYRGDTIGWKIVKVFDISQIQTFIKPKLTSYLQLTVNDINIKYLKHGEDGWQKQLILNAMKKTSMFKKLNKAEISYAMNCVIVACGDLLLFKVSDIVDLDLKNPQNVDFDYVKLYKFIKETITGLPDCLLEYVDTVDAKEKKKKEIAEAIRFSNMNIKQNIKQAQDIVNNRLQPITDNDNQIENVKDLDIGIPIDEFISDEDIYKGEI